MVQRTANFLQLPIRVRAAALAVTLAAIVIVQPACESSTAPVTNKDPESARLVFDDLPRFWRAFDEIHSFADTMPLRRHYLDSATAGLAEFTSLRWKNSTTLTSAVWARRNYYASIRPTTLGLSQTIQSDVRTAMRSFAQLYPDAVFPDVYFCLGAMATGGTIGQHGLFIGVELFTDGATSPHSELSPWQLSVIRPPSLLPIVAHEVTHYQQKVHGGTLLAQSILEGSADFVSELVTGMTVNAPVHEYGSAHQMELWNEFKQAMNGSDVSQWLYNGGSVTSTSRPADLGYFIGYQITKAYWGAHADKSVALRDILTVTNFPAFLAASAYAGTS